MPVIDPQQFWANAMGVGSRVYDSLRNSALGYAVQQELPRVANALSFYPTVTVNSPDYQAARQNLVNPQFLVPPAVAARHPNAARARGALTAVGNQTSGANMAMLAGAAATFGAMPELAAGTRLAPYVPGLLKGIGVAGLGAGAIQQMRNAPPASNPEARGQFAADLGLAALGTHFLLQPEAALPGAATAADFWEQAMAHPTVAEGEAFRPVTAGTFGSHEDMVAGLAKAFPDHPAFNPELSATGITENYNLTNPAPAAQPHLDPVTGEVVWPESYQNPSAGGGGNYTADDLAAFKAKHGIGPQTPSTLALDQNAVAQYNQLAGLPAPPKVTPKVGVDPRAAGVADAYDAMTHSPNDPAVRASYDSLINEVKDQYNFATNQLGIRFDVTDQNPYENAQQMIDDVRNNRHLSVWSGGQPPADHPLSAIDPDTGMTLNTLFRGVHDVFGHAIEGNDFSEAGEENAFNKHSQMFSSKAMPALTTETKGQASWFFNNKAVREGTPLGNFPEQKAALLPEEYHTPQQQFSLSRDTANQILQAHAANGGSIFSLSKGNLGNQDAFALSMFPDRTVKVQGKLTANHLFDFARKNADLLSHPNTAIGTWNNNGEHWLDVSSTTNDLTTARQLGQKYNQVSIYDLKNNREIPTGGTGEAVPNLPPAAHRLVELKNADQLDLNHYSTVAGLDNLDVSKFGTSTTSGAERSRAKEPGFLPRVYGGIPGQYYEPRITNRPFTYSGQVNTGRYYDIENDPLGIWQKAYQQGGPTAAENALRDAGFSGYRGHGAVASFDNIPVKPTQNPIGPKPRSGERGAVKLDMLLSPFERLFMRSGRTMERAQDVAERTNPVETAAAMRAGAVGNSWWQRSTEGLLKFGEISARRNPAMFQTGPSGALTAPEAYRFTGINASTSPNQPVDRALQEALSGFADWNAAGRPQNLDEIRDAVRLDSIPGAKHPNMAAALTNNSMFDIGQGGEIVPGSNQRKTNFKVPFMHGQLGADFFPPEMQQAMRQGIVLDTHMGQGQGLVRLDSPGEYLGGVAHNRAAERLAGVSRGQGQPAYWTTKIALDKLASMHPEKSPEELTRMLTPDFVRQTATDLTDLLANDSNIKDIIKNRYGWTNSDFDEFNKFANNLKKPEANPRGFTRQNLAKIEPLAARLFGDTSFNVGKDASKSLGAKPGFMAKRNGKLTGESGVLRSPGFDQPDAPTFYHKSEQVAKEKLPNMAPGDSMLATLRNNGVKDSEIKWMGLDDFLRGKPKVSKSDLLQYINEHKINLEEVNRTDTSAFNQRQADVQINRDAALTNFKDAAVRHLSKNFYPGSPRAMANLVSQHLLRHDVPLESILKPEVFGGIKPSDEMVGTAHLARKYSLENAEMEANAPKSARYDEYTLDGPKENYTEKLMTLPARPSWKTMEPSPEVAKKYESQWNDLIARQQDARDRIEKFYDTNHTERVKATNDLNKADLEQEILHARMINETVMASGGAKAINNYHSPHWDEMNVLAHVRHSDRIDAEGKKNLFIEEIQSDWHQAGRKKGYQTFQVPDTSKWTVKTLQPVDEYTGQRSVAVLDENGNNVATRYNTREPDAAIMAQASDARIAENMRAGNQVPEAPFKNNWHELAIKRMIREAAEKGYDRLSWTTGQQQADRYNLATHVREVLTYKHPNGNYDLNVRLPGGALRDIASNLPESKLEEYVGRDVAEKIKAQHAPTSLFSSDKDTASAWKSLKGVDLTMGGEGMKGFYDKILPDFVNKYAKKWGAKVGSTELHTGNVNDVMYTGRYRGAGLLDQMHQLANNRAMLPLEERHDLDDAIRMAETANLSPEVALGRTQNLNLARRLEGQYTLSHQTQKVHSIDITPEMQRSVMKEGQPISQLRGAPSFWDAATRG